MALIFKNKASEEIPEGAVMLNETQAIRYQMNIIQNWEKFSDVWVSLNFLLFWFLNEKFLFSFALRAGPGILGAMSAVSAFVINNHFRVRLKLGTYGRMSSYLSVVCIPACFATLFHTTVSWFQFHLSPLSCLLIAVYSIARHPEALWLPTLPSNTCRFLPSRNRRFVSLSLGSYCGFHVRHETFHLSSSFDYLGTNGSFETLCKVHEESG